MTPLLKLVEKGENEGDFTQGKKGENEGEREGPYKGGPLSSPFTQPSTNRHPVDELADVRAELKRLKAREDELRELLTADDAELVGDQFEASVRSVTSERVDTAALRKAWGDDKLKPFLKPSTSVTIRVTEREVMEPA